MLAFRTANVSTGAAIAIATSEMNSLVVMDFMRFRSLWAFLSSLSRCNVARDALALNKRRAMRSSTQKCGSCALFKALRAQLVARG